MVGRPHGQSRPSESSAGPDTELWRAGVALAQAVAFCAVVGSLELSPLDPLCPEAEHRDRQFRPAVAGPRRRSAVAAPL